ncbi:Hypothetical protein FRAAL3425 [Frankia alni ACN14a]|uniref:Uncharacterized protein n=1 Tax=Frankia alni (strain DSM 45986 / CECT 9034 / ACN14a) TaxID=326424 RepID=Q0RK89_FRAAA|nr:Hypothetical protein FRAAL3425 [Frankia alni ACN14a]
MDAPGVGVAAAPGAPGDAEASEAAGTVAALPGAGALIGPAAAARRVLRAWMAPVRRCSAGIRPRRARLRTRRRRVRHSLIERSRLG